MPSTGPKSSNSTRRLVSLPVAKTELVKQKLHSHKINSRISVSLTDTFMATLPLMILKAKKGTRFCNPDNVSVFRRDPFLLANCKNWIWKEREFFLVSLSCFLQQCSVSGSLRVSVLLSEFGAIWNSFVVWVHTKLVQQHMSDFWENYLFDELCSLVKFRVARSKGRKKVLILIRAHFCICLLVKKLDYFFRAWLIVDRELNS